MLHSRIFLYIFLLICATSLASVVYATIKLIQNPKSTMAWLIFTTALVLILTEFAVIRMAHLWVR